MIDRIFLLTIGAALLLAPAAFAHVPGASLMGVAGTPKDYCEDAWGDTSVHEYGPPADGITLFLDTDGAVGPCPYGATVGAPLFDGHFEWAQGGAHLVAGDSAQAAACGWPYPDHAVFPTIAVFDLVLSPQAIPVAFTVAADTANNLPPIDPSAPNCGDLEADLSGECLDACIPLFPPGLDQTYLVYVTGFQGHIVST